MHVLKALHFAFEAITKRYSNIQYLLNLQGILLGPSLTIGPITYLDLFSVCEANQNPLLIQNELLAGLCLLLQFLSILKLKGKQMLAEQCAVLMLKSMSTSVLKIVSARF